MKRSKFRITAVVSMKGPEVSSTWPPSSVTENGTWRICSVPKFFCRLISRTPGTAASGAK